MADRPEAGSRAPTPASRSELPADHESLSFLDFIRQLTLEERIAVVKTFRPHWKVRQIADACASSERTILRSPTYRRLREIVVLKTLGATRARIATIFSVEFAVLGLIAGGIGVIFATLLTHVLLPKMDIDFHVQWGAAVLTVVLAMLVTNGAGWAASFRLLGQKPLAVLREE